MNILLVEDDEFVRSLLAKHLEEAGYKVNQQNNVDDAMKALGSETFNLLITDIILPHKDGVELMKHVVENVEGLPIIAITGGLENAAQDYQNYADMFAERTLLKPIKKDDLLFYVKEIISS